MASQAKQERADATGKRALTGGWIINLEAGLARRGHHNTEAACAIIKRFLRRRPLGTVSDEALTRLIPETKHGRELFQKIAAQNAVATARVIARRKREAAIKIKPSTSGAPGGRAIPPGGLAEDQSSEPKIFMFPQKQVQYPETPRDLEIFAQLFQT